MRLFPRLPSAPARELAATYASMPLEQLENCASLQHDLAFFGPVGGGRVKDDALLQLQETIHSVARNFGYPDRPSRDQARRFDAEIAVHLLEDMEITPHEAAQDGVWQFVCCVLVPSVVRWRFPGGAAAGTSPKRFLGGIRNTMGRLWWRALILSEETDGDRYRLLRGLREDEVVQIMERPTIAGCRPAARAVARQFLDAVEGRTGRSMREGNRMILMRETQKRMLRVLPVLAIELMDGAGIDALARVQLLEAVRVLRGGRGETGGDASDNQYLT